MGSDPVPVPVPVLPRPCRPVRALCVVARVVAVPSSLGGLGGCAAPPTEGTAVSMPHERRTDADCELAALLREETVYAATGDGERAGKLRN